MPSLDFDRKEIVFKEFYDTNRTRLELAKNNLVSLMNSLMSGSNSFMVSKIEGRVKDKNECISKFKRKYRNDLEEKEEIYDIKNHITDLIGLRLVCLYEDQIDKIKDVINQNFFIINVTNKISEIEVTEGTFGYKGLHVDLKHNQERLRLQEYSAYQDLNFEAQIRTVVQDSWSMIDHKIKYKKMIPNDLKRRINTLAALFELADREFRAIRDATQLEIQKAETLDIEATAEVEALGNGSDLDSSSLGTRESSNLLDAFSFERIARNFFNDAKFESGRVDNFVQEIANIKPNITKTRFNYYLKNNIDKVKYYSDETSMKMNHYTIIRHCLYSADRSIFKGIITRSARLRFDDWLNIKDRTVESNNTI